MAKAETKLNSKAVRSVLRGEKDAAGVIRKVTGMANAVAAAAGPGNTVRVRVGRNRVRATVTTSTRAARRNQAQNRSLTRAIDAARGA